MKGSFVQVNGFKSTGRNLVNVAGSHQSSKKHMMNHTSYKLLGNVDVACAIDEARQREVTRHNNNASRYTKMLHHHIDISVLLSGQGLAFRAHDESKRSSNRGNFLELMDLLACYSHELRSFLDKEHVTYTSHDPQNDLIDCIAEEVRSEIQNRIHTSNFIAIMMDDTSDISNVEQSAVSVRLIHQGEVEEHLLGLIDVSDDQSADGLTTALLNTLAKYKIVPDAFCDKVVGQSYDGAATMSGELNGVQAQMQRRFPVAYYNHCVAHRMSLSASQSATKIPKVAKFFATIDRMINFFRSSPKRSRHLGHSLPRPGDTRWLSRDTAIGVIDSFYEDIGAALYEFSNASNEKAETQTKARGIRTQMQQVEFVFLLKTYRKIFEHCTPIIVTMQKTTLDAIQLTSMINDFKGVLANFNFDGVWEDTLLTDPELPTVRNRGGWRAMEQGNDGSQESWRSTLTKLGKEIVGKFTEQLDWRFANLSKFQWMNLVHPSKFNERKEATVREQRLLIEELQKHYPFAVDDTTATEYNLNVLYNNNEISILLKKLVRERDALAAQKQARRRKRARKEVEDGADAASETEDVEERDLFEVEEGGNLEIELVKEGMPTIQDLLFVIKSADLSEALPQVVKLLELAVTIPLTSVHCERVFSRMKRVVSALRSKMLQTRKENLVFLQVENRLLKLLAARPSFKDNVVSRFKTINRRRFERFSRK